FPVGPTRLAESSTSIPPPDPRSSTVSPACSSARAVGLPQPSEASTAPSGSAAVSTASYRFELTGSQPQAPLFPPSTRMAACPYFALTVSLIPSPLMGPPPPADVRVHRQCDSPGFIISRCCCIQVCIESAHALSLTRCASFNSARPCTADPSASQCALPMAACAAWKCV